MLKWFKGTYLNCYCAFCRKPRRIYNKRHLGWTDVLGVLVLSVVLSTGIWHGLQPKAILLFAAMLMVGELVVQLRWRMGMRCPQCGFDPLKYVQQPDVAARLVREHYERRKERADFLLTSQALIETQRRMQDARRKKTKQPAQTV